MARAEELIRTASAEGSAGFEWVCQRRDGSEFAADISLSLVPMRPAPLLMAHVRDITGRKAAEAALTRRIELEGGDHRGLDAPHQSGSGAGEPGDRQRTGGIGGVLASRRAYVFQLRPDGMTVDNTHEWVREGVSAQRHMFEGTPVAGFPWLAAGSLRGEVVLVPRVRDLPPEAGAERAEFERQSVESVICVPMLLREQAVGFIGFDSVTAEDAWTEEAATLLRTAATAVTERAGTDASQEARTGERGAVPLPGGGDERLDLEVDEDGAYTYASPKVKDLLGYEPGEVLGRTPYDLMPPEEAERVRGGGRLYWSAWSPSLTWRTRTCARTEARWSWTPAGCPCSATGGWCAAFVGLTGTSPNRSGRRRPCKGARSASVRLRQRPGRDGGYGQRDAVSPGEPGAVRDAGLHGGGAAGTDRLRHDIRGGHGDQPRSSLRRLAAGRGSGPGEAVRKERRPRRSGARSGRPHFPCRRGRLRRHLVHLRDVTEQKQAQAALRESEERFRSLVEATSDWIWEVDARGVIPMPSPKVRDLLGYEPAEVVGRTPYDLMPPEEAERVAGKWARYLANAQPFSHVENTNLHKDGHRWCSTPA